ncbi:exosortase/archaeosortase family protein [Horticoccus luteus]|uniref:Exosortase/archaeosortase family protein n=2 Tax=Horticoccus luteus TaxID=2862869 RepID=A0A8F9TX72_9BACT|nr:exosortase/archaeosortase family protein [Horticoccus luteus]
MLAAAWLLVWNQQRLEWSVNPTYGYGWAVPLLAAYLFWERWQRRGEARPPRARLAWLIVPALILFIYLPLRVIQEANPDWVKINWSIAGVPILLSLAAVFLIGGWRYVLFFAFPIFFCLTALPWPVWMEEYLVQSLMRGNAVVSAEVLTIAGHPAFAQGNLIQIGATWVNVEEACSGIRSLQTAFMVSLFFGEFYRFRIGARAGLMLASFGVAFIFNLLRTIFLTYVAGTAGAPEMERWHDTVGNVAMIAGLASLWLLAELFRRGRKAPEAAPVKRYRARVPFPFVFALAAVLWLGGSEVATAAWYRVHESRMPAPSEWDVTWPAQALDFQRTDFPERTRAILKYNRGESVSWRSSEGYLWQGYYLRWFPGRVSKFLSGGHYPTVCLPAAGLKLVEETGRFDCHVGGLTIPFRTYLFESNGHDVYVFHAIMEDVPTTPDGHVAYRQANSMERLRSVWRGERNLGQRVLGLAVTGPFTAGDARAAVKQLLTDVVEPASPSSVRPPDRS